jgi:predicted nucleic acid-binding protein
MPTCESFVRRWRVASVNDGKWSIDTLVERHTRIVLDANVLIYLIENVEGRADRSAAVIDAVEDGRIRASMSTLAYAEVLMGPARTGNAALFEQTAAELRDMTIDIVPVSPTIAEDAAWMGGQGTIALMDAVHMATARASRAAFVTNDRRIRSTSNLQVFLLDNLGLPEPPDASGP